MIFVNIGYVSQDPFLFYSTIKENLLLAKPDATNEEIWKALEIASADIVNNLQHKEYSQIGEKEA